MAIRKHKKARKTAVKARKVSRNAKKATRPKTKKITKKFVKRKNGGHHIARRKVAQLAGPHGAGDGEED